MARQTLTKTTVVGPYPTLPVTANSLDVTFAAAIVADKEQFSPSGDDILLAWNTDVSVAYTFTVTSVADPQKRTGDAGPYTLQAGEIAAFRVKTLGWVQSDGKVYLEANNVAIKFGVLAL